MFDLGVMHCDAVKYLTCVKTVVNPDLSHSQIDDLALWSVESEDDLYKFALVFVDGLYREYCERRNLDDLDLLVACDDARELLPRFFLEHFLKAYYCECDQYLNFGVLDFAFACMLGKKVSPEFEHKFSYYFWNFYQHFENDVFEIYRDYQDLLSECDDE